MRPKRICPIYECEPSLREGLGLMAAELARAGELYEKIAQVDDPIEFVVAEKGAALREGDAAIVLWDGCEAGAELAAGFAPGTHVYAVCPSAKAAGRVADACSEDGAAFYGALLVPNLAKADALTHSPRMGFARRQVNEAADRLLYAARVGAPFESETARFRTLRR